ncbi:MAG: GntR family transcriptional regulator [Planctomycetes bacterium]|nr:GntR family transcriptional regulator [Planctomycetota bacterium]
MRPLDFDSDVPVYEQIKQQVTFGIARGSYPPGEKLPSVRGLAKKLLVNPNTILRVYRELEQAGLVRTWRGKGVFVSDGAHALCFGAGTEAVERALRDALELAQQAGVKPRALDALYRRLRKQQDAGVSS